MAFACNEFCSFSTEVREVNRFMPISAAVATLLTAHASGLLPSAGVTRLHWYYEPIRHLPGPILSLAGQSFVAGLPSRSTPNADFPCCAQVLLRTCRHHYPGRMVGCVSRSLPPPQRPSSLLWRVGSCICIFEACSVFTRVTARTLRCHPFRRRLLKCFRPFVTSWPAPSASGRSERGRVGIAPTELLHLHKAHTTMPRNAR